MNTCNFYLDPALKIKVKFKSLEKITPKPKT